MKEGAKEDAKKAAAKQDAADKEDAAKTKKPAEAAPAKKKEPAPVAPAAPAKPPHPLTEAMKSLSGANPNVQDDHVKTLTAHLAVKAAETPQQTGAKLGALEAL